jgi:hypothetical protein
VQEVVTKFTGIPDQMRLVIALIYIRGMITMAILTALIVVLDRRSGGR